MDILQFLTYLLSEELDSFLVSMQYSLQIKDKHVLTTYPLASFLLEFWDVSISKAYSNLFSWEDCIIEARDWHIDNKK
jgi:hypothetical protein